MGAYFRIAPRVRLRATRSGLRIGVGPRSARFWAGSGRPGMSTGAGPVTLYRGLGGRPRRSSSSMAAIERQARQARHLEEINALAERLREMVTIHRQFFPEVQPPLAPAPEPVDEAAVEKRHRRAALKGVPFFRLRERRAAKERAEAAARQEVIAEGARREGAANEEQRALDGQWQMLLENDPKTVLTTLEEAFSDNEAPAVPVDCQEGRVTVLMLIEGPEAVPERVPKVTPTGRPSSRKLNKTERNELYLGWMSSNILATMREAFAVAPRIAAVTVVVLAREPMTPFGESPLSAIYAGTLSRERCERIVWDRPEALDAILHTEELLMELKGRTKEVSPIDLESHPDLASMVDQVRKTLVGS